MSGTPDTRPHVARMARATRRTARAEKAGTLDAVREKLWACIERVERLATEGDPDAALVLRSTHALVQACGAFVKVVEVGELEARLAALEAAQAANAHRTAA